MELLCRTFFIESWEAETNLHIEPPNVRKPGTEQYSGCEERNDIFFLEQTLHQKYMGQKKTVKRVSMESIPSYKSSISKMRCEFKCLILIRKINQLMAMNEDYRSRGNILNN